MQPSWRWLFPCTCSTLVRMRALVALFVLLVPIACTLTVHPVVMLNMPDGMVPDYPIPSSYPYPYPVPTEIPTFPSVPDGSVLDPQVTDASVEEVDACDPWFINGCIRMDSPITCCDEGWIPYDAN